MMCWPPLLIVLVVEMIRMMRMSSRSLDMYLEVVRYTSSHLTQLFLVNRDDSEAA